MDKITPECRSRNMRAIRSKDMKPERLVRSLIHRMGYRYRLHSGKLPGKPDLVFQKRKKVIFVHGCFWHQHSDPDCEITRIPKSNINYWQPKLTRNKERDRIRMKQLEELGWDVLVLWECEVKNSDGLADRIRLFLDK
jgi:DNA mismatch endonuclease (patch repair protein)